MADFSRFANKNLKQKGAVYAQTNLNGYYFDAYITITHSSSLNVTEHKVESGGVIADHAYLMPREVQMQIAVSDATVDPFSQFAGSGSSRSINAYKLLQQLQRDRVPITVYTKFDIYQNCLIKELSTEDNANNAEAMHANITLVEVPTAYLETSKISIDWQTTDEARDGILETVEAGESLQGTILYQKWSGQRDWPTWFPPYNGMNQ